MYTQEPMVRGPHYGLTFHRCGTPVAVHRRRRKEEGQKIFSYEQKISFFRNTKKREFILQNWNFKLEMDTICFTKKSVYCCARSAVGEKL
jgi:hypothetical protein